MSALLVIELENIVLKKEKVPKVGEIERKWKLKTLVMGKFTLFWSNTKHKNKSN